MPKADTHSNQPGRANDEIESPRDRPFNAWRTPQTEKAKAIVRDIIGQVQVYERYYAVRKRRRKNEDQQTFEATVSALICDAAQHYLTEREGGVFVTRSNQVLGQGADIVLLHTASVCRPSSTALPHPKWHSSNKR